jgi:hypothetical protein
MIMLRHRAALGFALLCASCDLAHDAQDTVTVAPHAVSASDVLRPAWKPLAGPSERLGFYVGALESERSRVPLGECVPLADGALLARFSFSPTDYEGLTCFVELESGEAGLRPRAAGVFYGWCVGLGWVEAPRGTVALDTSDPRELLCRVDLDGEDDAFGGLPSGHVFQREFRILPDVDSAAFRSDLDRWPEGPALATKR